MSASPKTERSVGRLVSTPRPHCPTSEMGVIAPLSPAPLWSQAAAPGQPPHEHLLQRYQSCQTEICDEIPKPALQFLDVLKGLCILLFIELNVFSTPFIKGKSFSIRIFRLPEMAPLLPSRRPCTHLLKLSPCCAGTARNPAQRRAWCSLPWAPLPSPFPHLTVPCLMGGPLTAPQRQRPSCVLPGLPGTSATPVTPSPSACLEGTAAESTTPCSGQDTRVPQKKVRLHPTRSSGWSGSVSARRLPIFTLKGPRTHPGYFGLIRLKACPQMSPFPGPPVTPEG